MTEQVSFPPRPSDGHKGTFGSVCVIGGQRSEDGVVMVGAPALVAIAAMRSGCGKVVLAMPQPLLLTGLAIVPVATGIELPVDEVGRMMSSAAVELLDTHTSSSRCYVIGPGFGSDWPQQQFIATMLSREDIPIILDADGLNALSQLESGQQECRAPTIMTPHIREYERLAAAASIDVDTSELSAAAASLAQAYGCVVVLKSSSTAISDGVKTVKVDRGGVVLATGGSGDVLSGIIAGILVQFGDSCVQHLMDAAVLGVHVHAMAGKTFDSTHGNAGMLATDLLERIPASISAMRSELDA